MLEGERDALGVELASAKEEKSRIEEMLESERRDLAQVRKTASSEEKAIALLKQQRGDLMQQLEEVTTSKEEEFSDYKGRNKGLEKEVSHFMWNRNLLLEPSCKAICK